jgi:hypothetical protein
MDIECCKKIGFIPEKDANKIQDKTELTQWFKCWTTDPFSVSSHYDRMAALEDWLGPTSTCKNESASRYVKLCLDCERVLIDKTQMEIVKMAFSLVVAWPEGAK